jgi:hypothetical protein
MSFTHLCAFSSTNQRIFSQKTSIATPRRRYSTPESSVTLRYSLYSVLELALRSEDRTSLGENSANSKHREIRFAMAAGGPDASDIEDQASRQTYLRCSNHPKEGPIALGEPSMVLNSRTQSPPERRFEPEL